jgi:hypothetical protein
MRRPTVCVGAERGQLFKVITLAWAFGYRDVTDVNVALAISLTDAIIERSSGFIAMHLLRVVALKS